MLGLFSPLPFYRPHPQSSFYIFSSYASLLNAESSFRVWMNRLIRQSLWKYILGGIRMNKENQKKDTS